MPTLIRRADLDHEANEIADLLVDYMTTALQQLQDIFGITDSPTDVASLRDSVREYRDPSKALFVVQHDDRLVGLAGLRTLEPGVVEVKRMYVDPGHRGHRFGAGLLEVLLEEAPAMGAATVRLDTARFMADAQRLYRSRGFEERDPYPGTEIPPHLQKYWIFFEKQLSGLPLTSRCR
ncbi:hypothetical protein GCM10009839_65070 [Catenulispora yoronensis]|uniref:N-acetyltransferase domain-containing protein n=1 Tax=Catenulispora yoronensis TaxID=450799 RepID=A0ABP5GMU4_9ACTN